LSFKRFVSDAGSGGCTGSDGASTETGNLLIVLMLIAVDLLIVAGKKRQKDEHENDNEDEHDGKRRSLTLPKSKRCQGRWRC
jgi:hypothetical protein